MNPGASTCWEGGFFGALLISAFRFAGWRRAAVAHFEEAAVGAVVLALVARVVAVDELD